MAQLPAERLDTFSGDAVIDLLSNVALGQIPNAELVYIFGHTPAIAAGSTAVLWPLDGLLSTTSIFPLNPVSCYISSANILDIGNVFKVKVLDSNYNVKEYGIILNGQNTIALPIQVRRVVSIENMGSTAIVGNVYAGTEAVPVAGVPARINTLNMVLVEDQISHSAVFTVPAGYVLLVHEFGGGTPTADSVRINALVSNPGTSVFKAGMHLATYRTTVTQRAAYFPLAEKTDLYLSATAYTNNTEGYGFIFGTLLPSHYMKT